jgi:hypothetical protein
MINDEDFDGLFDDLDNEDPEEGDLNKIMYPSCGQPCEDEPCPRCQEFYNFMIEKGYWDPKTKKYTKQFEDEADRERIRARDIGDAEIFEYPPEDIVNYVRKDGRLCITIRADEQMFEFVGYGVTSDRDELSLLYCKEQLLKDYIGHED